MTLVVAVTAEKSIWMSTDRRLSFPFRRRKDDARKVLFLDTTDGAAMLGYAGLGSTALGTEPGDWMARVLRGRNLPLEQSLAVLADAVRVRFPRHLEILPVSGAPAHNIIIPAFLNRESKLYSIDLVRSMRHNNYSLRLARHVSGLLPHITAPRIAIGGSGAAHLIHDRRWARELLRTVTAHDAGRISAEAVARVFAHLNNRVARAEKPVGRRCIVAWRLQIGGGAHAFFAGVDNEASSSFVSLPSIVRGLDMNALLQASMPSIMRRLDAFRRGETEEVDREAINAELAKLPQAPDDSLD
jgi:hypothetical protein